jgi:hypothetical protein
MRHTIGIPRGHSMRGVWGGCDMDALVLALAPGFVAGFAVQRVLEIFDAVVDGLVTRFPVIKVAAGDDTFKARKAFWSAVISVILGFAIAYYTGVRVLQPLQFPAPDGWDMVITALVISAGSEGMNSILKWLGYKKDKAAENV